MRATGIGAGGRHEVYSCPFDVLYLARLAAQQCDVTIQVEEDDYEHSTASWPAVWVGSHGWRFVPRAPEGRM